MARIREPTLAGDSPPGQSPASTDDGPMRGRNRTCPQWPSQLRLAIPPGASVTALGARATGAALAEQGHLQGRCGGGGGGTRRH